MKIVCEILLEVSAVFENNIVHFLYVKKVTIPSSSNDITEVLKTFFQTVECYVGL